MGKKNFNNFGANRPAVTPRRTLTGILRIGSYDIATNLNNCNLLGGTASSTTSSSSCFRLDKQFIFRMRQYLEDVIVGMQEYSYSTTNVTAINRGRELDVSHSYPKWLFKTSGNVPSNTEAWYTHAGKRYLGLPLHPFPASNLGESGIVSGETYSKYVQALASSSAASGFGASEFYPSATNAGAKNSFYELANYTPFSVGPMESVSNSAKNSTAIGQYFSFGLADLMSGATIGQKYAVSELIGLFRKLHLQALLNQNANADGQQWMSQIMKDIEALPKGGILNYSRASYVGDIPEETRRAINVLSTVGIALGTFTGGVRSGLFYYEASSWSGMTNIETIERIMSGRTISNAYSSSNAISTVTAASGVFSVQGRAGALRSLRLVCPDVINRAKFEHGVGDSVPPKELYSGLVSMRPLGKFTSLTAADGFASEVRVKEDQLSLWAIGAGRMLDSVASLPFILYNSSSTGTSVSVLGGSPTTHSETTQAFISVLRSRTVTLDNAECKYYALAEITNTCSTGLTTANTSGALASYGTIDPEDGGGSFGMAMSDLNVDAGILIRCVVPYEVDNMKVKTDGSVEYLSLAEGSEVSLSGTWGWKAGMMYIKGSYLVFTRVTRYQDLQTSYGSSLSVKELLEKAADDFLTECQGYFTTGDTDPNPVEQYLGYTPLRHVGYDLPLVESYEYPVYDYLPRPLGSTKAQISPAYKRFGANKQGGLVRSSPGAKIQDLYHVTYGVRANNSASSVAGYITPKETHFLPLLFEIQAPPIDGGIGYYTGHERPQQRTRLRAMKFNPIRPKESFKAEDYAKRARMGFRSSSLNVGVLRVAYWGQLLSLTSQASIFGQLPNSKEAINILLGYAAQLPHHRVSPEQLEVYNQVMTAEVLNPDYAKTTYLMTPNNQMSSYGCMPGDSHVYNFYQGATRTISGVACRDDVPTQFLPIKLFDRETGRLIAETLSGVGGKYKFYGLQPHRTYMVLVSDPQREFNSDVEDIEVKTV